MMMVTVIKKLLMTVVMISYHFVDVHIVLYNVALVAYPTDQPIDISYRMGNGGSYKRHYENITTTKAKRAMN